MSNLPSLLQKLWCWIVGHEFYVLQKFSHSSRRICCDRCGGDWGMNDDVQALIPWSSDLESIYRMQGHGILKR